MPKKLGKVAISCAVTGAIHTPTMSDALPYKPEDIADQAIEAAEAGAAVLHIHARDPQDGSVSLNPDHFMNFLPEIKSKTKDYINSQIPIFVNSDVISLQKEALMIKDTSLLLNSLDSMLKKIDYYSTYTQLNSSRDTLISLKEKVLFFKKYDEFMNTLKIDLDEKSKSYVKNMLTTAERLPIYNSQIEPIFERDSVVNNTENNEIYRFYNCKVKKLKPGILASWSSMRGEYKIKTKTIIYFSADRKIISLRNSDTKFESRLIFY